MSVHVAIRPRPVLLRHPRAGGDPGIKNALDARRSLPSTAIGGGHDGKIHSLAKVTP